MSARTTPGAATTLGDDDPRHGTTNGYSNFGCRCAQCTEANRLAQAAYKARLRAEGRVLGAHGTDSCYDSGCRCDECRAAHNRKSREYKRRRRTADADA
jgi:hypothetical protein